MIIFLLQKMEKSCVHKIMKKSKLNIYWIKSTIRVEASRKVDLIGNSGLIVELPNCEHDLPNCEHEKGNCEGTVSILCATL